MILDYFLVLAAGNFLTTQVSAVHVSNLSATNLSATNLSAFNLSALNLSALNFSAFNLSAFNLSAFNLPAVKLSSVNLSAVNPSESNLPAFNLSSSDVEDVIQKPKQWEYTLDIGINFYWDWKFRPANKPDEAVLHGLGPDTDILPDHTTPMSDMTRQIISDYLRESLNPSLWHGTRTQYFEPTEDYPYAETEWDISAVGGILAILFSSYFSTEPGLWNALQDIAWWIWVQDIKRQHPDDDPSDLDYSGLKYYLVPNIEEEFTVAMIEWALSVETEGRNPDVAGPDENQRYLFFPGRDLAPPNPNEPFWALCGTPFMAVLLKLMAEHKQALKGRKIQCIGLKRVPVTEEEGGLDSEEGLDGMEGLDSEEGPDSEEGLDSERKNVYTMWVVLVPAETDDETERDVACQ